LGSFIFILLVVLLSVEVGYRLGKYRRSHHETEKEAPLGTTVGATLGLLAFILAFTFGLAASRFDNRRQLLLGEARRACKRGLGAGFPVQSGSAFSPSQLSPLPQWVTTLASVELADLSQSWLSPSRFL
jgi:hypothetical protein